MKYSRGLMHKSLTLIDGKTSQVITSCRQEANLWDMRDALNTLLSVAEKQGITWPIIVKGMAPVLEERTKREDHLAGGGR